MLIAVFEVWSYTSWGSTLPGIPQRTHRWTLLAVMILGLFINAGITNAFDGRPLLFVVPYLLCRIGPAMHWRLASSDLLEHCGAMLVWFFPTGIVWAGGAAVGARQRLWWWAAAAVLETAGSWLAHPVPFRIGSVPTKSRSPRGTCSNAVGSSSSLVWARQS